MPRAKADLEAFLAGSRQRFGIVRAGHPRPLLSHAYRPAAGFNEATTHQLRLWNDFLAHFGLEASPDCTPLLPPAARARTRRIGTRRVLFLLVLFAFLTGARADPQLTSWFTANSGKYARIYSSAANQTSGTTSTTWSRGSGTPLSSGHAAGALQAAAQHRTPFYLTDLAQLDAAAAALEAAFPDPWLRAYSLKADPDVATVARLRARGLDDAAARQRIAAQWTADAIGAAGLEHVQVIDTPGHPVVYGDWLHAPGKPTILFYGHYDVQPVDPIDLWESPPFDATVRDGEIYARGAADDKGQVFMHFKAIEAHMKQNGRLPVNIRLVIEGEEEVGSAHLDAFIEEHKAQLAADVVVISDSAMFDRGVPSICYALRGLAYFQIDLRGTTTDLHSGVFGGAVANPAMVLAQLLSQMKDKSGRIKIDGFYDDVVDLRPEERAEWEAELDADFG